MAVGLTWRRMVPRVFAGGAPIRSGASAGDEGFGFHGLNERAAHLYANRGRVLGGRASFDRTVEIFSTSATGNLGRSATVTIGQDIAAIRLDIDCGDADVTLSTGTFGSVNGTIGARGILTLTRAVSGGPVEDWFRIDVDRLVTTARVYGWALYERRMVAGDFP